MRLLEALFGKPVWFISFTSLEDDDIELEEANFGRLNRKNFIGDVDFFAIVATLGESG